MSRSVTTKVSTGGRISLPLERVEDPQRHNPDKERYNLTLSFR